MWPCNLMVAALYYLVSLTKQEDALSNLSLCACRAPRSASAVPLYSVREASMPYVYCICEDTEPSLIIYRSM